MAVKIKGNIKYLIKLDNDQQEAFQSIINNQITIITGRGGTGKTICTSQAALDLLFRRRIKVAYITRAMEQVGKDIGFLPGSAEEKFDPYIEPFMQSLYKNYKRELVDKYLKDGKFQSMLVQFIRGKTIDNKEILFVEEAQNLSKEEMLAIITRLGKRGKIVISGDNNQKDTRYSFSGLDYAIELSKEIEEIKYFNLTTNHRSGIVKKVLDYEENKN